MNLIRLILLAFEASHEYAKAARSARRAGIDAETDEEFRTVNDL
jgi:hypothetical protein